MIQFFYRLCIELTNGKFASYILQKFVQSRASRLFIRPFVKTYNINTGEMEQPIWEFASLQELFTRKLKNGARPVCTGKESVASPVDGILCEFGEISGHFQLVVKGKEYSILDMLGNEEAIEKYREGKYIYFYLSPRHYHRIHSPFSGKIIRQWTLGNRSYPVNSLGLKFGKKTLSKNFRKITEVKHGNGTVAIVKIGAMYVNSIVLTHDKEDLQKGEELAYFSFGSSVILLFEKDTFCFDSGLAEMKEIKVGERIGFFI